MIIRKYSGSTWEAQSVETDLRSIKTANNKLGSTTEADYVFDTSGKIKEAHLPDFLFGGMRFVDTLTISDTLTAESLMDRAQTYIGTYGGELEGCYFIVAANAGQTVTISGGADSNNGVTHTTAAETTNQAIEEDDISFPVTLENGDWIVMGAQWTNGSTTMQRWGAVNNTYGTATTSSPGIMSAADKSKLDGIATGANAYTHPTHPGDDINLDTGALTGATVISDLDFNITSDTQGHITDANASYATRTLTLANLGYTGATDANNYTHPTHPGDDFDIDTGALTGAVVISDLDINLTSDSLGHITDANAAVSTRTLTLSDLGYSAPGNGTLAINGTTNQVAVANSGGDFTANDSGNTTETISLSYPVYYADTQGALPTGSVPTNAIGFEY